MKIVGIIAEYNPFHNGHAYHLKESLKRTAADYSIAVMSGNFLQRGEPALYDKWTRAEIAVKNGVDLIIEIPFAFACNNAEYFAKGAFGILNGLGCVSHLSFGSETGDISGLIAAASILANENPNLSYFIKEEIAKGVNFPKARYEALRRYAGDQAAEAVKKPNNILAVEYLKQGILTKSTILPIAIKRFGSGYDERKWAGAIASATAIRQKILVEGLEISDVAEVISSVTLKTIKEKSGLKPLGFESFYELILYKILMSSATDLEKVFSATEGLENRVLACAKKSLNAESLIKAIKTKRYTETRIQRLLIHILLDLTKDKMKAFSNPMDCLYARVLALNSKGSEILSHIKKEGCSTIPIITNINRQTDNQLRIKELLDLDIMTSDIYNLGGKTNIYKNSDHVAKLYFSGRLKIKIGGSE